MRWASAAGALLLGCAAGASGLTAQASARPTTETPPIALPVQGMRPAEVVARLAHEALSRPSESGAWKRLAGALPQMVLDADADPENTFEAARLADSLASPAPDSPTLTMAGAQAAGFAFSAFVARLRASVDRLRESVDRLPISPDTRARALGLLAVVLSGIVVWSVAARRRRAARVPAAVGSLGSVGTLAASGDKVPDIARRLGVAQEAVDLALRLTGAVTVHPPGRAVRARHRTGAGR